MFLRFTCNVYNVRTRMLLINLGIIQDSRYCTPTDSSGIAQMGEHVKRQFHVNRYYKLYCETNSNYFFHVRGEVDGSSPSPTTIINMMAYLCSYTGYNYACKSFYIV